MAETRYVTADELRAIARGELEGLDLVVTSPDGSQVPLSEWAGLAAGEYEGVTHAGIAVVAADTGRVLLAQRALDETDDPEVQETWELPGGGLNDGEDPQAGAFREFGEEVEELGLEEFGEVVNGWRAGPEGNYQGFVVVVPDEGLTHGEEPVEWFRPNDEVQALAWVHPDDVPEGMTIRPEMADLTAPPWTLIKEAAMTESAPEEIPDESPVPPEEDEDDTPRIEPMRGHGVLAPEGVWSGDRRKFAEGSLRYRDLPLPMTWQKSTAPGHDAAVTVYVIEKAERIDNMIHHSGRFLSTPEANEVIGLIGEFGRFGVSIDADDIGEFEFDEETGHRNVLDGRISAASIVHIPAFQEAYIALGPHPILDAEDADEAPEIDDELEPIEEEEVAFSLIASAVETFKRGPGWITHPDDTRRLHRYWTEPGQPGFIKIGWGKNGSNGDFASCVRHVGAKIAENSPEDMHHINAICAQWHHDALGIWPGQKMHNLDPLEHDLVAECDDIVLTASAQPKQYEPDFFSDPGLTEPTGVTVTPEGRVYGHVAAWGICHIGISKACVTAPKSKTDYAYFLTGTTYTTDGGQIETGRLTYGTGHADTRLGAFAAANHYDDTGTVWADVTCGEDEVGIWFSGRVRDNIDSDQLTEILASGRLSGDWREIAGNLEMVAALSINTGGFPLPRGAIAASGQTSLVAAGIVRDRKEEAATEGLSEEQRIERAAVRVIEIMAERQARADRAASLRDTYAPIAAAARASRIESLRAQYQEV